MAQMKEQIKAPEKIQLSNRDIANQSDAQFKTLVIRKLTELVESSKWEMLLSISSKSLRKDQ